MKAFRDRLLDASDRMESAAAPPRLAEVRDQLRKVLRKAERERIPEQTAAAALLSEALPRIIACYGPSQTAALLIDLARNIGGSDPAPLQ
jgi:hypothetical protein